MSGGEIRAVVGLALLLVTSCGVGWAQNAPATLANPNFEQGKAGEEVKGWFVTLPSKQAGWTAVLSDDHPKSGKACLLLSCKAAQQEWSVGSAMQTIDASAYRGKRIHLRGFVRLMSVHPNDRAQMWLRVDKTDGSSGLFDNMDDRRITKAKPGWQECSIVGDVDADASEISLGVMSIGAGKVYFDAVSLTVLGKAGSDFAPPRPLSERGLQNLTAFTRLLGYVRYFYPGDVAAKTDWNAFAVAAIPRIEAAKDSAELAQKLISLFKPVAPLIQVWPTGDAKLALPADLHLPAKTDAMHTVSWKHLGYGFGNNKSSYSSERVETPLVGKSGDVSDGQPDPQKPMEAEIGGGVMCRVPLALYADAGGTLPRQTPARSHSSLTVFSGNDRSVRLADAALAWNVFQHFYPYFEEVKTDWPSALTASLQSAATDSSDVAFTQTLRRLVAALQDGHGGVYGVGENVSALPFTWRWIENKLVITQTLPAAATGLNPGDVITLIDGKPAADVLAELENTISSATPQWKRWRAVEEIAKGPENSP